MRVEQFQFSKVMDLHHDRVAGRDPHPVDIGIHTQSYAWHALLYIQPEFTLPLQNGRQEAKIVCSPEHAHFKCQRARRGINIKKSECLLTSK